MAHAVARRTGEIVIRMALGAQRWRLLWDVAAEGAQLTLGSVVIGVVIDSPLQSVARSLLYRVAAAELVNMVSTTGLLLSVAIVASLVPALRYSYRSDRGLRLTERGEAAKRDATVVPPLDTCGAQARTFDPQRRCRINSFGAVCRDVGGRQRDEHERGTRRHDGGGSHQRQP